MRPVSKKVKAARRRYLRSLIKTAKAEEQAIDKLLTAAKNFEKNCDRLIVMRTISVPVAVSSLLLALPEMLYNSKLKLTRLQRKLKNVK